MDVVQAEVSYTPVIVLEKGKTTRWTYINAISEMRQTTGLRIDLHNHRKLNHRWLFSSATHP